jgi:hypothetical protein
MLVAFRKWVKVATFIIVSSLLLFILEDITRLQPWVYTQVFMLILLSLSKEKRSRAILFGILLIFSSTYFWSGIQKINLGFITNVVPWYLSKPFGFDLYLGLKSNIPTSYLGFFIIPLIEILIGILLLFNKTRKKAIAIAIVMHLLILFFLSPIGHNWNHVVWIWNISLILLLITILRENIAFVKSNFKLLRLNYFVFIMFIIMPIFNFFGYWDSNLSGMLYSGTISKMTYYSQQSNELVNSRKREDFIKEKEINTEKKPKTDILYWAYQDINVFGYPEPRYYKRIAKHLCITSKKKSDVIEIIIKEKFTAKQKIESCSCQELLTKN